MQIKKFDRCRRARNNDDDRFHNNKALICSVHPFARVPYLSSSIERRKNGLHIMNNSRDKRRIELIFTRPCKQQTLEQTVFEVFVDFVYLFCSCKLLKFANKRYLSTIDVGCFAASDSIFFCTVLVTMIFK